MEIKIDEILVQKLVASQIPQWKHFPIRPVAHGGWDNRTFHLGDQLLVRLPSAEKYAVQVEKEHRWLPILAPLLPLHIPAPLVMGNPTDEYPFNWSVYRWIQGETVAAATVIDLNNIATNLAHFLSALQTIDSTNGPLPSPHNFHRGGSLNFYDVQTQQALELLKDKIDIKLANDLWQSALATSWDRPPVWVHGDIAAGNLLVQEGKLSAVIDFGGLAIGDPACDLVITWTLFKDDSRKLFHSLLPLDAGTWARGRAWALWKALIIAAGITKTNAIEDTKAWRIIDEVLDDYKSNTFTLPA